MKNTEKWTSTGVVWNSDYLISLQTTTVPKCNDLAIVTQDLSFKKIEKTYGNPLENMFMFHYCKRNSLKTKSDKDPGMDMKRQLKIVTGYALEHTWVSH